MPTIWIIVAVCVLGLIIISGFVSMDISIILFTFGLFLLLGIAYFIVKLLAHENIKKLLAKLKLKN